MHDFHEMDLDKMYFEELAETTRFFKETKEGVKEMTGVFQELREQAWDQARVETEKSERKNTALRMLQANLFSPKHVSLASPLPLDEVCKLQAELQQA